MNHIRHTASSWRSPLHAGAFVAMLALAACGGSSESGTGEITTGSGTTTGTGSVTGTGSNTGSANSSISDFGSCEAGATVAPLAFDEIYELDPNTGSMGVNSLVPMPDGTGTVVIDDQETYQPFQDKGMPAVDFTTKTVLVTAAYDPSSCGGSVGHDAPSVKLVDGTPRLEITYYTGGLKDPSGFCSSCDLVAWSVTAVTIAKATTPPTFCLHVDNGCH